MPSARQPRTRQRDEVTPSPVPQSPDKITVQTVKRDLPQQGKIKIRVKEQSVQTRDTLESTTQVAEFPGIRSLLADLGILDLTREHFERQIHDALAGVFYDDLQEKILNHQLCIRELGLDKLGVRTSHFDPRGPRPFLLPEMERRLIEWAKSQFAGADPPAYGIEQPEPKTHERQIVQQADIIIKPDGTLVKAGLVYRPLSNAAPEAQVHPTTLLRWINNPQTKFEGRPLQTYYFAPAHTYFIAEESLERVAKRFIKWPSQEPAGRVTIGETNDKNGFIGMPEAADIARVSRRTMWLWVSQGKAPIDQPLDVIKDPASDTFYIREKDAHALKKHVPRAGLHRGRRPQLAPQP
jgi:hypothetical protein